MLFFFHFVIVAFSLVAVIVELFSRRCSCFNYFSLLQLFLITSAISHNCSRCFFLITGSPCFSYFSSLFSLLFIVTVLIACYHRPSCCFSLLSFTHVTTLVVYFLLAILC